MLTREQYKELKRYEDSEIPIGDEGLSEIEEYLLSSLVPQALQKFAASLFLFPHFLQCTVLCLSMLSLLSAKRI